MKNETVKKMLERFYEGTASPEEERRLREYFASREVPPELSADREIFAAMAAAGEQEPSLQLQKRLEDLIDDHYVAGRTAHIPPLRRLIRVTLPLAASLLLLVGAYFFLLRERPRDTYSDPQLAYQETKRILMYVSEKFNQGTQPLTYLEDLSLPAREMKKVGKAARIVDHLPYLQLPGQNPAEKKHEEK